MDAAQGLLPAGWTLSWANGPVAGSSAASAAAPDAPEGARVLRLEAGECASCQGEDYAGRYVRSDRIAVSKCY